MGIMGSFLVSNFSLAVVTKKEAPGYWLLALNNAWFLKAVRAAKHG
jgi:hypothetical protein